MRSAYLASLFISSFLAASFDSDIFWCYVRHDRILGSFPDFLNLNIPKLNTQTLNPIGYALHPTKLKAGLAVGSIAPCAPCLCANAEVYADMAPGLLQLSSGFRAGRVPGRLLGV